MPHINIVPQSNAAYFNAIVENDPLLSTMYPDTAAIDYAATASAILENPTLLNAFISTMINKIGETVIRDAQIRNPLDRFKGGLLPYGKKIEDVFVDVAEEHFFDQEVQETEQFKREIPDVSVIYHVENRKSYFKQTISQDEMRGAFYNEYGLNSLIDKIVNALYKGDQISDFKYFKALFNNYAANGFFYPVAMPAIVDEASAKAAVKLVRGQVGMLQMPSRKYNSLARMQQDYVEDLFIFMTPVTQASIDVDVLAAAFHMEKADFLGKIILIDELPAGIEMILTTKDFFVQRDTVFNTTVQMFQGGRYYNVQLNHDGIYSTCRFANAVAFMTTTPSVTSVAFDPSELTMNKGMSKQLNVKITGTEQAYVPKSVTWEVIGNTSDDTYISATGLLLVSPHEKAASLTVKATSTFDTSKYGELTVTLQ